MFASRRGTRESSTATATKIIKPKSKTFGFWQGQKDLNPRPMVLETSTLPTELYPYEQSYYTIFFRHCQGVFTKKIKKLGNKRKFGFLSWMLGHNTRLWVIFRFSAVDLDFRADSRRRNVFIYIAFSKSLCYNKFSSLLLWGANFGDFREFISIKAGSARAQFGGSSQTALQHSPSSMFRLCFYDIFKSDD